MLTQEESSCFVSKRCQASVLATSLNVEEAVLDQPVSQFNISRQVHVFPAAGNCALNFPFLTPQKATCKPHSYTDGNPSPIAKLHMSTPTMVP